ncbi:MAG: TrmB family transcriptional regulator [Candidatus Magasanikbacteria bacterium]|jgi:HTH-type transcriptional regulator, sugar sensing transcriptional regulator|nr:TrmB family transcriptional regulator [Candidatus Magasanikbacteria bacterium]
MDIQILKNLGFSDKHAKAYLALLSFGPSSVRRLAEECEINRGTTYDALKWLQEKGLVDFYKKDSKQHFVAKDPEKLHDLVREKQEELQRVDKKLGKHVSELQALYHKGGERPIARYYERKDLHLILEDVLEICEADEEKECRIYSAAGLREYLYESFPTFSDVRIAKGIGVKVIALGEGGQLRGLDERKWLDHHINPPTYIIIYPGKTAYISLDAKGEPVGVVVENDGVYQTQKVLFETLWKTL